MNDHSHDLDLIAALGEGWADDEDLARRLLDECGVCRHEFQLQRQVRGMLQAVPVPSMTESERQHLHQALALPPGGRVITLRERRRAQTWIRLGTAAAALLVLIGLGSVFLRLSGAGSDGDAAAAPFATTTAALDMATTAAAMESFGGEEALSPAQLAGGDEAAVQAEIEQLIEAARSGLHFQTADRREEGGGAQGGRCLEQLDGNLILAAADSMLDGRPIVIYVVETETEPEARVLDSATCAEIELG